MKHRKITLFLLLYAQISFSCFALNLKENDPQVFLSVGNDKFSYGLSQNKDDQLTAATQFHITLPNFFADFAINSITNRGFKTDAADPASFTSGRYDELLFKAGTSINLYTNSELTFDLTAETGFYILGNFGMDFAQNINHKMNGVSAVKLEYEKFDRPFAPLINSRLDFFWQPEDFIKFNVSAACNNSIFYFTEQALKLGLQLGNKTEFSVFTGYTWKQALNSSPCLKAYKDVTSGFNYGFSLNTGFAKFDFINYTNTRFGLGTISVDFLNLSKHKWKTSDLHFFTGACYIINTEFLENQIQSKDWNNFSCYYNNKYVSGFKKNRVNPSEYRYERDYIINTIGIKYQQPLPFIQNWVSPYVEVGTGLATFGIQKLTNHIPEENYASFKYKTKSFWQIEANIGLNIIPQGLLNFGSACYSLTLYAGTLIIPEYKKASRQIEQDSYRSAGWHLKPFEFKYGFTVHMALDF